MQGWGARGSGAPSSQGPPPGNQQLTPNQGRGLGPSRTFPEHTPTPPRAPHIHTADPALGPACPHPPCALGRTPRRHPHLHPVPDLTGTCPTHGCPLATRPGTPRAAPVPLPAPAAPHGPALTGAAPAGPRVPPALRPGPAARSGRGSGAGPAAPPPLPVTWGGRSAREAGARVSLRRPPARHTRPLEIPLRAQRPRGAPWASVSSAAWWGGREGRGGAVGPAGTDRPAASAGAECGEAVPAHLLPAPPAPLGKRRPRGSAPAHFSPQPAGRGRHGKRGPKE